MSPLVAFWLGGSMALALMMAIEVRRGVVPQPLELLRAYPARIVATVVLSLTLWPAFLAALLSHPEAFRPEEE